MILIVFDECGTDAKVETILIHWKQAGWMNVCANLSRKSVTLMKQEWAYCNNDLFLNKLALYNRPFLLKTEEPMTVYTGKI